MNKKCTTVNCSLTGCKYNSACCANPACKECYCTLYKIDLIIDEENGLFDCKQYEYDYTKPYECIDCQLEKHGEIEIVPDPVFVEVDDLDDIF